MQKWLQNLTFFAPLLLLSACATAPTPSDSDTAGMDGGDQTASQGADQGGSMAGDQGASGATASGMSADSGVTMQSLDDPSSPLANRTLYFAFDSAQLTEESRDIIRNHAGLLAGNIKVQVVLEGHADERGTREYNIGLGDRRANAVRKAMSLQGVDGAQISTVSYGEEKPVAMGHDESSWQLNRRVEIIYQGQ